MWLLHVCTAVIRLVVFPVAPLTLADIILIFVKVFFVLLFLRHLLFMFLKATFLFLEVWVFGFFGWVWVSSFGLLFSVQGCSIFPSGGLILLWFPFFNIFWNWVCMIPGGRMMCWVWAIRGVGAMRVCWVNLVRVICGVCRTRVL